MAELNPKLCGSQTRDVFKAAAEIAVITESAQLNDPADLKVGFSQIPLSGGKATGIEIAHNGSSCGLLKLMGKMRRADVMLTGKGLERIFCDKIGVKLLLDAADQMQVDLLVGNDLRQGAVYRDQKLQQQKLQHLAAHYAAGLMLP